MDMSDCTLFANCHQLSIMMGRENYTDQNYFKLFIYLSFMENAIKLFQEHVIYLQRDIRISKNRHKKLLRK